ncbi:AtzH-like domain-containing protein [Pseudolysinimonas sp.]|uniref:AtzH-like domain-containing protein n=1 Tax=Pseudolysinimonas sp. TaxID=2680009 RepID=UPI003F7F265E
MTGRHAAAPEPEPEGLREAVLGYEAALMADDVASLDDWFESGPETLRGDAGGLLVGHEAIAAFRRSRGGAAKRTISRLEIRALADDLGVAVLVVDPAAGGHGMLTQVWRRAGGRWRIVAAQVAAPAPAVEGRVWRVAGAPLVAAPAGTGDAPLAGRSVAVKDLFAVAGFAIGAGNPAWLAEAALESATAPAVQRLLEAGATIAGIARTDEFAYAIAGVNAHYGAPPNAAVPGAIPGGSTSGPASAVALGQADIGLGTDTGGSVRVPASYQGLWGLRTTHGAVDRAGLLPLAPSFDTVGWLTRDAATLRAALVATLGETTEPLGDPLVAPRLASVADAAVTAAFGEAVRALGIPEAIDPGDLDELFETFRVVQAAEAWASHGAWLTAHPGAVSGAVAERFAIASRVTAGQEAAARDRLAAHRERLDALLGDRVLVLPSASSAAPALGSDLEAARAATMRLTCIAGITGRPGLSVPLLRVPAPTGGDAPVGLGLVGPRGSDLALVDVGARIAADLARHAAETPRD